MTEFPEDVWAAALEAAADVFLKPSAEPYAVIFARAIMQDRASRIRSCLLDAAPADERQQAFREGFKAGSRGGQSIDDAWANSIAKVSRSRPIADKATAGEAEDDARGEVAVIEVTNEVVSYIARYGGRCRDCADEDGICPTSGLPCEGYIKAIRHVLEALNYGVANGYISKDPPK